MSAESVGLLRERVIRAAIAWRRDSKSDGLKAQQLVRAVDSLERETWRADEAPLIIQELLQVLQLVELRPAADSSLGDKIKIGTREGILRAKAFLGERKVEDDTTPIAKPRKGILRRRAE